jgi:PGF-pre-PGF domain-containing protein
VTGNTKNRVAGLVLGILFLAGALASAAIITINPGDLIQTAINTAGDGDTILLNPGAAYTQHDIEIAKNITIGANTAAGGNPSNTVIDAQSLGRVFNVSGNVSLTVDNLTLQNGRAPDGADGVTIPHSLPRPGGHGGDGGAISAFGTVTILSSLITGCSAGNGGTGGPGDSDFNPGAAGGEGGSGGAINSTFGVTIADSTISSCLGGNGGNGGISGGMMSPGGNAGNGGSGGAVSSDYPITITSSHISDCSAGTGGTGGDGSGETWGYGGGGGHGGAFNTKSSNGPVTVTSSEITSCSAGNGGATYDNRGGDGGHGGAIASLGPVNITSSAISACSAGAGGDSTIYDDGYGGGGGAIYGYLEGTVTVAGSSLTGNNAGNGRTNSVSGPGRLDSGGPGGYGGAIYIYSVSDSTVTVTSSALSGNAAGNSGNGGAIASGYHIFATSSNFTGNSASSGSAVYAMNGSMHFNRIYSNTGSRPVVNFWTPVTDYPRIEANNNWWGANSSPSGYVTGNVTYSPWLLLGSTATPYSLPLGDTSVIRANLTYNSDGINTSADGSVPDAIPVAFSVVAGSGALDPSAGGTDAGTNATAFAPSVTGISTIRTTVDGQYVDVDVMVPVTARFTGTPVTGPAPLTVQFNDTSDCTTPLTWNWSFGNGDWFNTTDILQRNASYTYNNPGTYTVSLTIADAATSNTSTRTDYITVLIPPPAVNGITPSSGINTTTVSITNLSGTWFNTTHSPVSARLNRTGQADIPATGVTVVDSTNLTCTFDLTGREAGIWNVVVTNPDGQEGLLTSGFTIDTTTPSVTEILPSSGYNSSTVSITNIGGSGFWPGSTTTGITLRRSGYTDITGSSITVVSDSNITGTFDLTGREAGLWDVVVTNPDAKSATLPAAFEILPPVPAVSGITPGSGVNTTIVTITSLNGSGFWPGSGSATGVILNGTGYPDIPAGSIVVVDGTNITCTFDLTGREEGFRNIVVTNPDGQVAMLADGFRIWAPGPEISGITPAAGVNTTSVSITNLAGSGFWTGHPTDVMLNRTGQPDIVATGVTVVDDTNITCTFDLTGFEEGIWNVVVTNPDGQEAMLPDGFRIWAPAPVITSINPASGVNTSAVSITNLAGSGFWAGYPVTVILNQTGYPDIVASGVTVVDSTNITCTFDLTGQEAGLRNVVVTNPDGQEAVLADGFTVRMPGPGIFGITPSSGINTRPVNITSLSGSGFWITGTTVVFLNRTGQPDIAGTEVTVVDSTMITCTFDLTGQESGLRNVVVINPDGQEFMLANGFMIRVPVEPSPGPTALPTLDGSDSDYQAPAAAAAVTTTGLCGSGIVQNVSVNIGGSSAASRADTGGVGISDLILTGTSRSRPDDGALPQGTVYQYIDLVAARYCSVTYAAIFFFIPQSWLDGNHIAAADIVLYRSTANGWEALPTTFLRAKDGTAYYSAASPGFSLFAIAGIPSAAMPEMTVGTDQEPTTGTVQPEVTTIVTTAVTTVPVTTRTTAPPAPAPAPVPSSPFPVVPVLIAVCCAVLIGGIWYVRRWWIRRQNPALFMEYD